MDNITVCRKALRFTAYSGIPRIFCVGDDSDTQPWLSLSKALGGVIHRSYTKLSRIATPPQAA